MVSLKTGNAISGTLSVTSNTFLPSNTTGLEGEEVYEQVAILSPRFCSAEDEENHERRCDSWEKEEDIRDCFGE